MQILKITVKYLLSTRFFIRTAFKEGLKNPFKQFFIKDRPDLFILANGPSLSKFLESVDRNPEKYISKDFAVVNDFVKDDHFVALKPKYCVMSDPLFFYDTIYSERGHAAMKALAEKVDWPMLLIIPQCYAKSKYLEPLKSNSNITIIKFHSVPYSGNENLRYLFYRYGLGNGEFGTVALNALYAAIMMGYKKVYMLGIDHNFFDNLGVNDNNELCHIDSHFYEKESEMKPIMNHYGGLSVESKPFRVSEFLYEKASIFRGHEIVNNFAKKMGVKVYNCTEKSMVDEYDRIKIQQ